MGRTIALSVAHYVAAVTIASVLGTIIGSFVLGEFWTPMQSIGGRASVAWLGIIGLIPTILKATQ